MQVHPASIIANKQLIIIASIHQPSTSTFNRFDKVYLLAKGHLCYGGLRTDVASYFKTLGFTLPPATNPAEWILELVDTDFAFNKDSSVAQLDRIIAGCESDGTKPTSRSFFQQRPTSTYTCCSSSLCLHRTDSSFTSKLDQELSRCPSVLGTSCHVYM
jgi:ABC-type multidrug transport system ATPase subunit